MKSKIHAAIDTLRRQRVRQNDFVGVLDCVIAQANMLRRLNAAPGLDDAASQMLAKALELKRISRAVPKFVVEDLIDESVKCLESVLAHSSPGCSE